MAGLVNVSANRPASGTDPITGGAAGTVVSHNKIVGGLACSGNIPAASNGGVPNTVNGLRTGECASPRF